MHRRGNEREKIMYIYDIRPAAAYSKADAPIFAHIPHRLQRHKRYAWARAEEDFSIILPVSKNLVTGCFEQAVLSGAGNILTPGENIAVVDREKTHYLLM